MAATRGLVRMAVPAAVVLLGGCTTLGPDFQAPQVPWLQGWSGGAWRTLADEAPRRAEAARRRMVAPVRRPGARPAGGRGAAAEPGRAHRRPAHPGGAGPARHRRQRAVSAAAAGQLRSAGRGQPRQQRPGPHARILRPGLRPGLGAGLLGQVQARHRVGRCRLLQQHRVVRRRAGAGRGADGEPVRNHPHHRAAAAHRQRERRDPAAQPGDHRTAVPQRQRCRARRAAGALAVPGHAGDDPRDREQPAPDAQRAVRAARPAARCPARAAGRAREDSRSAARGDRRPAGRDAAAPARRARRRDAAGRAVGADRHQRSGAVPVDRARRVGGSVGDHLRFARRHAGLGPRPGAGVERVRPWPADEPGAGAGRALPAAVRAVPGRGAARRPRARRCGQQLRLHPRAGRHPARCRAGREALARHRHGAVSRRPGRLPACARFAACAVQRAGAPGGQPGRRGAVPDRRLQGDGRRLAGRALAAAARRRHANHDGRAQRLEGAAAGPAAAAFGASSHRPTRATRHDPGPCRPARRSRAVVRVLLRCHRRPLRLHPRAAAPASAR